jgi:hypothetical protein
MKIGELNIEVNIAHTGGINFAIPTLPFGLAIEIFRKIN